MKRLRLMLLLACLLSIMSCENVFHNDKLDFLWRPELVKIQENHEMPRYKEKSKSFVVEKIGTWIDEGKIDPDTVQAEICELLFERDYNTIFEEINRFRQAEGLHKRRRRARRKKRSK